MSGPSSHALLSASAAHRWLNCPPSARMTEDMPERKSEYAEEGSVAHALLELHLRKRYTTSIKPSAYKKQLKEIQSYALYKPEMEGCIEAAMDHINQIASAFPSLPYVAIEQQVDYSEYVPEGFGTADCVIIGGSALHICDYKHGQGILVEAEKNPQMMLYALGAIARYKMLYDIQHVVMHILQPRKDNITSYAMHAGDLLAWGESIKPIAQKAWMGAGVLCEGDWCRFCKAKAQCPERARAFTAMEDFGFTAPLLLEPAQIGDILTRGKRLADWLEDVQDYALATLLNGEEIPGYKAVEGRAIRVFTDADAAFNAARAAGIDEAMLYERKPITLAALEKVMGKKPFADVMTPFVVTPPGKPTLAPLSDKREPITRSTAQDDFKEDISNG